MIIGITGNKRAGKDTAAEYLVAKYGFTRIGLADKVKEALAALLEVEVKLLEKNKDNNDAEIVFRTLGETEEATEFHSYLTVRWALQRMGTEVGRNIFGKDFWIDQVVPFDLDHREEKIVIPDVRFVNEADRIRSVGGTILKIVRESANTKDTHSSETELRTIIADMVVANNDSLVELYKNVDAAYQLADRQEKIYWGIKDDLI